ESSLLLGSQSARVNRSILARTESLHVMADVGERSIEFPAQPIVQGYIRPDIPAILGKRIDRSAADVFALRRTLSVAVRQTQQITGIVIAVVSKYGVCT